MAEAESRSQTLSGFQKFTDSLVEKYKSGQAPMEVDSTTREAIENVTKFIDSFFPHADVAHNQDLAEITRCTNQDCDSSCAGEFDSGTISGELNRLETKSTEMVSCIEENENTNEQNAHNCYAYDWYRNNIGLPDCVYQGHYPDICSQDDPDEDHPYLGDFCDGMITADSESVQLEKMEECLVAFNEWFNGPGETGDAWILPRNDQQHIFQAVPRTVGIFQLYNDCKRPGSGEQSLVCQEYVTEYHMDHCEYALVLNHECEEHSSCIETCDGNCNICDDIKIKAGARKADNETGERIKCLLNVLIDTAKVDKKTELEACTNATAIDRYELLASHFDLTCDGFASASPHATPTECESAHLAISCSSKYMEKLLQMKVDDTSTLADYDLSNPKRKSAFWNSCDCGHKCTAAAETTRGNNVSLADIAGQNPDGYRESDKCNSNVS